MEQTRIDSGAHYALLDALNGAGILIAPDRSNDMTIDSPTSLHGSDWDSIIRPLARAGWTVQADEWDLPARLATLPDGSAVYGLYPALDDLDESTWTDTDDHAYRVALLELIRTYSESR